MNENPYAVNASVAFDEMAGKAITRKVYGAFDPYPLSIAQLYHPFERTLV